MPYLCGIVIQALIFYKVDLAFVKFPTVGTQPVKIQ